MRRLNGTPSTTPLGRCPSLAGPVPVRNHDWRRLFPLHGDLDTDGHVGVSDLFLVLEELGCMGTCNADLDNDHTVGIVDLMSFLASFGETCGQ